MIDRRNIWTRGKKLFTEFIGIHNAACLRKLHKILLSRRQDGLANKDSLYTNIGFEVSTYALRLLARRVGFITSEY